MEAKELTEVEKALEVLKKADEENFKKATEIMNNAVLEINKLGLNVICEGAFSHNKIDTSISFVKKI